MQIKVYDDLNYKSWISTATFVGKNAKENAGQIRACGLEPLMF